MPKLGDFVGALLADAVQARVSADMEALKIAEAYSGHELLKHLPVPRFRLPDITVDFPVLVTGVQEATGTGGAPFGSPTRKDINEIVSGAVSGAGITLTPTERTKVSNTVLKRSEQLFSGPQFLLRSPHVSRELATTASTAVGDIVKERAEVEEKLPLFENVVRNSVRTMLLQKLTQSPHLQVNVTSADIKSHGHNDSLVRVRLTISEDAYEVINREDTDSGDFKLVPE